MARRGARRRTVARPPAAARRGMRRALVADARAAVEPASVSLVVPGTMRDGTRVVLKLNYPEPESAQEADALRQWDGHGAVRLVADDPERRALLIERCEPGDQLWSVADEDEANLAAAEVFRRIWRQPPPGHPYRALADLAAGWAEEIPRRWRELGRPFERALLDARDGLPEHRAPAGQRRRPAAPGHARRQRAALGGRLAGHRPQAAGRRPRVRPGLDPARPPPAARCATRTPHAASGTASTCSPRSWGWTGSSCRAGPSCTRWPGAWTIPTRAPTRRWSRARAGWRRL